MARRLGQMASPHNFPQRDTSVLCAGITMKGGRCNRSSTHLFCFEHDHLVRLVPAKLQALAAENWETISAEGADSLADQVYSLICVELGARRRPKSVPLAAEP